MKEEIKFRLGDRVYAPFHGYGVVTAIHEDACVYPIEVTWDDNGLKNMEDVSTFTADGLLSKYYANTDTILTVVEKSPLKKEEEEVGQIAYATHKKEEQNEGKSMAEDKKFKVGDRVKFISKDNGTIINISKDETEPYPIEVRWADTGAVSTFTEDGYVWNCHNDDAPQLTIVHKAAEAKEDEFKIGDWVFYPYYGMGTVIANYKDGRSFPIEVQWSHNSPTGYPVSTFTKEGVAAVPLAADEGTRLEHVPIKSMSDDEENDEEDEGTVERMEDALNKKVEDAINLSHYKVDGLPEAIDIINHLMHREQYEGFLWGNILKYAYRYGRKGDKAETAGKIAWYAQQLKKLKECESE